MIDALSISESGLRASQKWIDTISNNVANMQTVGYKKMNVNFANLVSQVNTDSSSMLVNESVQDNVVGDKTYGVGTQISNINSVFTNGSIKTTNNQLDFAIQGNGFFEVVREDGSLAYTRAGQFKVNSDGVLTTQQGLSLSSEIYISPDVTAIAVESSGAVKGHVSSTGELLDLGEIKLARITDPESLRAIGNGLYINDDSLAASSGSSIMLESPGANGTGNLLQGFLEMSNVDLIEEMTGLITAQRAYQLNARIIQISDQVMETVNNLRR